MKSIVLYFVIVISISIVSCGTSSRKKNKYDTALKFILYSKENNVKGVANLLMQTGSKNDTFNLAWDIGKIHDYLDRYGIPPKEKWSVEYDTTSPVVKLIGLVIPIYTGFDSSNGLERAILKLNFDYTKVHLSHDSIFNYDLDITYRRKKIDTTYKQHW